MAGTVLGSIEFARSLQQKVRTNSREQPAVRKLQRHLKWADIVAALEQVKRQTWRQFSQLHGDWGRDAALWLGRKRGGYTLAELGQLAGGMDYAAVGQAVSRFGKRLQQPGKLQRSFTKIAAALSNVEM